MASREPWYGQVDIHSAQEIPIISTYKVEISLDILNLSNLLNKDSGLIKFVNNQRAFLLNFASLDPATGKPHFTNGNLTDPAIQSGLASRWLYKKPRRLSAGF
jgi:hypothetical protein